MDGIVALKKHLWFKCVHDNHFPEQLKDKVFFFKNSINLLGSDINLVNQM